MKKDLDEGVFQWFGHVERKKERVGEGDRESERLVTGYERMETVITRHQKSNG